MIISLHGEQMAPDTSGNTTASASPPFWELEALLASGCDLGTALTMMSARRAREAQLVRWLHSDMVASPTMRRLAS